MRSGSLCMISRAFETAATLAGGMLALKIRLRELCFRKFITVLSAAMNPPSEPKLLLKVPMMRSTLSVRPK